MFRRRYMPYIVTAEIQTANVAYFQGKIQLSGSSSYPVGWPLQLIRISGVLLYSIIQRLVSFLSKTRISYVPNYNVLSSTEFREVYSR